MNERVKLLRATLGISLEAFGSAVGVKRGAIFKIEKGENNVSELMIRSICSAKWPNGKMVNEDWLRTGEGPMFLESGEADRIRAKVDEILTQDPESYKAKLVSALADLDDEGWQAIYTLGKKLAEAYLNEETEDERIEREAEMVKRNYIESQKGRTGSGSSGGGVDTG